MLIKLINQCRDFMVFSIQYMRAIAAIMVVLHHIAWKGKQYSTAPISWYHIGEAGVDLFFIISGYVMCMTTERKNNVVEFLVARIKRIIPLYWFLSIISLIIYLLYPDKVNSSGGKTNIFASFFLFPVEDKYLIQNGWTLSYEFYFYAIFSICFLIKNNARYLVPAMIIFSLVMIGMLAKSGLFVFNFITNSLLIDFLFGIIIFHFLRKKNNVVKVEYGVLFVVISLVLFVLINFHELGLNRVVKYGIPCVCLFVGMIILESFFKDNDKSYLSKILSLIGESSYSLYLFHPFSLVSLSLLLKYVDLAKYGWFFVLMLLVGSILSGVICFRFIEKPLSNIMKGICSRKSKTSKNQIDDKPSILL